MVLVDFGPLKPHSILDFSAINMAWSTSKSTFPSLYIGLIAITLLVRHKKPFENRTEANQIFPVFFFLRPRTPWSKMPPFSRVYSSPPPKTSIPCIHSSKRQEILTFASLFVSQNIFGNPSPPTPFNSHGRSHLPSLNLLPSFHLPIKPLSMKDPCLYTWEIKN